MNKKDWLAGGIILVIFGLIKWIMFLYGISSVYRGYLFEIVSFLEPFSINFLWILYPSLETLGDGGTVVSVIFGRSFPFFFGYFIIFHFVIGAVIGLIYTKLSGRIRLRNFVAILLIIWLIFSTYIYLNSPDSYGNTILHSLAGSTKSCSLISTLFPRFDKDRCLFGLAQKTLDLSACEKMPPGSNDSSDRSECYSFVATEKRDYTICNDKIPEAEFPDYFRGCISQVAGLRGECEMNPGSDAKDHCYLYQSEGLRVSARDNRCDIYKDQRRFALCEQYIKKEITTGTLCSKIADPEIKEKCLTASIDGIQVCYDSSSCE